MGEAANNTHPATRKNRRDVNKRDNRAALGRLAVVGVGCLGTGRANDILDWTGGMKFERNAV